MEKRKPLSVMIALQADKLRGGKGGGAPAGEGKAPDGDKEPAGEEAPSDVRLDDEDLITASEDMIDAFKNRDAKALNAALCHWQDFYKPRDEGAKD